jgi:hypothetical protein
MALGKLRNQMKFFLKTILALADHMGSKKGSPQGAWMSNK